MPNETKSEEVPQEVKSWLSRTKEEFSAYLRGRERNIIADALSLAFLVILFFVIVWGVKEFIDWLSAGSFLHTQPQLPQMQLSQYQLSQTPLPQPQHKVIGTYQHQVYLFNQSTQKAYPYDVQTGQLGEEFHLASYEDFVWSPSRNKVVFISNEYSLGSLYVVDLDQSPPHPVLITKRENGVNFPSNVVIRGDLPLAWNESADRIAFVAHKPSEERDALFVIAADGSEYYRLPEKERITSLAWSGDKIVFVAFENGQEKRFVVDFDGGNLRELK
jgi:Tol biopolymer transport system component